jgi:hypothetical protein
MLEFNVKILVTLTVLLLSLPVIEAQQVLKQGYAVNLGFPVTYSSIYNAYEDILSLVLISQITAGLLNIWIQINGFKFLVLFLKNGLELSFREVLIILNG